MARASSSFCVLLVASLLVNAFCVPAGRPGSTPNRPYRSDLNEDTPDDQQASASQTSSTTVSSLDEDDDDDFGEPVQYPQSGGGSNIISLLNLATALFPSSSSSASNRAIRNMIRQYLLRHQQPVNIRRQDVADNVIEIDYVEGLTPPFQRQEDDDDHESDESNGGDDDDDDDDDHESESDEHNDAAEESIEDNKDESNDKASKQDSNGDADGDNDSDYSDEPEGDGQGGGILGLLAGLSGGEEGSDLGTLLATVSQIVGNLSGDGFDLNALLASAFGLFVGLLSEGEENPGTVIASYLLTSLDTITGGGSKNNGAFFGNLLSKLVKGTSAVEGGSDESSEENGNGMMKMSDSTGFFSGTSSSSGQESSNQQASPLWTLKMSILRAFLQFGTSILGLASSSFTNASAL